LGRFSPEEYTWITPGKGAAQIGVFVATVFSFMGVVYMFYPDKPSVPRTFPHGGLEKALGGPRALPVGYYITPLRRPESGLWLISDQGGSRGVELRQGKHPTVEVSIGPSVYNLFRSSTSS